MLSQHVSDQSQQISDFKYQQEGTLEKCKFYQQKAEELRLELTRVREDFNRVREKYLTTHRDKENL